MSYKPVVAAALSGATLRQLSYWRSSRSTEAPLLAPALHEPRARVSYSFPDVVALRTFVYLRSRNVPLQRVRKAVQSLRDMGNLTRRPGQQVIAQMVDILAAFRGHTTARWCHCIGRHLAWR